MRKRSYTFYFRSDGKTQHRADHKFLDDLDALDAAQRLSSGCEVEVWSSDGFVARVKKGNEPLNVRDRRSG
jgi:hypothetical protein